MTLGGDAFKLRSAKMISWSLIEQSITPDLMTCLACEVRITSIRELDESVTLVGEAINYDRLNDSQKLVRDLVSVHSAFRRLCTQACPEKKRKSKWLPNRPPNR